MSILFASHKKLPNFSKVNTQLQQLITGTNGNVVLEEVYKTGLFLKSYFIKIKVYDEVKTPTSFIFSIDQNDWLKMKDRVDYSLVTIFYDGETSFEAIPAGLNYVDNPSLGKWVQVQDKKTWHFHRPYQYFIEDFAWKDFRPTLNYYQKIKNNQIEVTEEKLNLDDSSNEESLPTTPRAKIRAFFKSLVTLKPLI